MPELTGAQVTVLKVLDNGSMFDQGVLMRYQERGRKPSYWLLESHFSSRPVTSPAVDMTMFLWLTEVPYIRLEQSGGGYSAWVLNEAGKAALERHMSAGASEKGD